MEDTFRLQVLRAVVRDRQFLKASSGDLDPVDFPNQEERIVAKAALKFYTDYGDPIGALLRSEVEELAAKEKPRLSNDSRTQLKVLLDTIQGGKMELVSMKALQDRVKVLRKNRFYENALEEIVTAHEAEELSTTLLSSLIERANIQLADHEIVAHDYLDELEQRIARRAKSAERKMPLLMIDPLDKKIQAIGRGHMGLVLAPYKAGKSLALSHIAAAYALQGYKGLYISLEDPKETVEDRFDASLTGIPLSKLNMLPNRLRKRFARVIKQMRGRLRIIDASEGGWNVTKIERAWEQQRQQGFVADYMIVDYDDEIEAEKVFKGESGRRFEFAEIYRRLRKMTAKLDIIFWTASQAPASELGKKVVQKAAEDVSKLRKAFLVISIGVGATADQKHLYVLASKLDRDKFGVDIATNFDCGLFYDREATMVMERTKKKKKVV